MAVEHLSGAQAGRGSIIYAGCVAFPPLALCRSTDFFLFALCVFPWKARDA